MNAFPSHAPTALSETEARVLALITEDAWMALACALIPAGQPDGENPSTPNPLGPDELAGREGCISDASCDWLSCRRPCASRWPRPCCLGRLRTRHADWGACAHGVVSDSGDVVRWRCGVDGSEDPKAITIYGIKNCDTMKRVRAGLDAHGVAYAFHDYKAAGIDRATVEGWAHEVGWEVLLNRAGTTFRKLPDADKAGIDEKKAVALMLAHPSMIKRPVLEGGGELLVGFSPDTYASAFR